MQRASGGYILLLEEFAGCHQPSSAPLSGLEILMNLPLARRLFKVQPVSRIRSTCPSTASKINAPLFIGLEWEKWNISATTRSKYMPEGSPRAQRTGGIHEADPLQRHGELAQNSRYCQLQHFGYPAPLQPRAVAACQNHHPKRLLHCSCVSGLPIRYRGRRIALSAPNKTHTDINAG